MSEHNLETMSSDSETVRSPVQESKESPVNRETYSSHSTVPSSLSPPSSDRDLRYNLYAQELNNSAVSCIEIGMPKRALVSLKKALELYNRQKDSTKINPCNSYQYSLDGCISYSEACESKKDCNNTNPSGECFISNKPIKVAGRGHAMGPALHLIIVYNLALVYHMIATTGKMSDAKQRKKIIHAAITTYNLAFKSHGNLLRLNDHTEEITNSLRSIRFKMMILNNTSQLYKMNRNETKYNNIRKMLLSIMMVVVDQRVRASSVDSNNIPPLWRIELEGFVRNTASLVLLPKYTADVA